MHVKKILVVNDEMAIRFLYQEVFQEIGYDVFCVEDGGMALQCIEDHHVGLVILDIKMSEMDGIEVLKQIKNQKPNIKVILNSAYDEYINDFAAMGADYFWYGAGYLGDLCKAIEILLSGCMPRHWCNIDGPPD